MFSIEVLRGIGQPPIVLDDITQVVVRMPNHAPVSVASLYGAGSMVLVSHCKDPEFKDVLRKLGVTGTVIVEEVKT
jgi:hypothetical protein